MSDITAYLNVSNSQRNRFQKIEIFFVFFLTKWAVEFRVVSGGIYAY